MKVLYRVHGIVQGVGYRNFVRIVAKRHNVRGAVKNVSDGSVEIVAVGAENDLLEFEKEIQVSTQYGPQVMQLERISDASMEKSDEDEHTDFLIKKDKKL